MSKTAIATRNKNKETIPQNKERADTIAVYKKAGEFWNDLADTPW